MQEGSVELNPFNVDIPVVIEVFYEHEMPRIIM